MLKSSVYARERNAQCSLWNVCLYKPPENTDFCLYHFDINLTLNAVHINIGSPIIWVCFWEEKLPLQRLKKNNESFLCRSIRISSAMRYFIRNADDLSIEKLLNEKKLDI